MAGVALISILWKVPVGMLRLTYYYSSLSPAALLRPPNLGKERQSHHLTM